MQVFFQYRILWMFPVTYAPAYTVWKRNAEQLQHFAFPYSPQLSRGMIYQNLMGLELRYFLTMRATLKVIACSNSRRSSPVILRILSRR